MKTPWSTMCPKILSTHDKLDCEKSKGPKNSFCHGLDICDLLGFFRLLSSALYKWCRTLACTRFDGDSTYLSDTFSNFVCHVIIVAHYLVQIFWNRTFMTIQVAALTATDLVFGIRSFCKTIFNWPQG